MSFNTKLDEIQVKTDSMLCVGLDSELSKIPNKFQELEYPQFEFNKWIVDQTHELVCAYKPNSAFYESEGSWGVEQLKKTIEYIHHANPELLVILDAKRGDIGNTSESYCRFAYDYLDADAITVQPYLGQDALVPFLNRADKGCIVLCKTSNPGSGEFQDLIINQGYDSGEVRLWETLAKQVTEKWNVNDNCILVVGATYPQDLKRVREIAGDMPFLIPGIGAQGGELAEVIKSGVNRWGRGLVINSSRGIIFAENPGEAAKEMNGKINQISKQE